MMKTKLIIVIGFVLAFAAGWVTALIRGGRVSGSAAISTTSTTGPTTRRMSFAQALGLTPDQDRRIHQLRETAFRDAMREVEARREELRRQRDDSILAMLSPDNRLVYETVMQHYTDAMRQVDRERPKAFDRQDEQIKQMLTAEQRTKFEDMLKRMEERRHREMNRRVEQSATTHPATTLPSH